MRPRRILIGGLPYFGRMLAGLLTNEGWQARYLESARGRPGGWMATAAAVARTDLVYLVGGQIERWSRPDWLTRAVRRPIVMHWLGSDITYALAAAARGRASSRLVTRPTHWTEVVWTADELRPLGIRAEVVALTSTRFVREAQPLPDTFTVLTYLPVARPDFYGRALVMRLAEALPEVRFIVVGSASAVGEGLVPSHVPANVEFLSWVEDMAPVYARSTVLLRMAEHDGLSFMVLEALAAGRHVIWNHPLECVLYAADEAQARDRLELLLGEHRAGPLALNASGRRSVMETHSPERVRDEILTRFERLLGEQSR
ncbi:MAG TPA: glycosyltransferase [Dehalococcoidia bacterium]|nr:glycosyltransferase [Dehalococcoidia bacterium]